MHIKFLMHINMGHLVLTVMAGLLMAAPVWAQNTEDSGSEPKATEKAVNPHLEEMNEQARELAGILTAEESQALGIIRENHGIIGSIEIARQSVEEAVQMCAEENETMAGDIKSRHEDWHTAIGEELEAQKERLEKAVNRERFSDVKKIRDYLGTLDEAAGYANTHMDKKIVTTEEACTNLMNSMDDTQTVITGLLEDLEWPGPETGSMSTP